MKPNFNNCSDIKGLRFFSKEICPYYCSGGVSIHRIDELFPLKPSLVLKLIKVMKKGGKINSVVKYRI